MYQLVDSQPSECDFTFELSRSAGSSQSIVWGGTAEAEANIRGQLVIMRMKGRQTILGV